MNKELEEARLKHPNLWVGKIGEDNFNNWSKHIRERENNRFFGDKEGDKTTDYPVNQELTPEMLEELISNLVEDPSEDKEVQLSNINTIKNYQEAIKNNLSRMAVVKDETTQEHTGVKFKTVKQVIEEQHNEADRIKRNSRRGVTNRVKRSGVTAERKRLRRAKKRSKRGAR
jgi:hypothetical protein